MTVSSGWSRVLALVAIGSIGVLMFVCTGGQDNQRTASTAEGVPAPDTTLTESSPVAAFLRYGDLLRFAADSPGVVTLNQVVNGVQSELRVRSEMRLPHTPDTAYVRGRIIAKFETMRGQSRYGAPIGNAYLWVRDTGGGNFRAMLMWRNFTTGDTGRAAVVRQMHCTARANTGDEPECIELPAGDTIPVLCCLCGGGQYNCPLLAEASMQRLDSLLSRANRPPLLGTAGRTTSKP